jgi:tetratricopeptide (TPR) repeat protein
MVGVLLGPLLIWLVVVGVTALAGRGASGIYMPTGVSTPRKREYSRAEALLVRGDREAAIAEYEAAIAADPSDPEPYLRVARILRDQLKRPADAIPWFRRAVREARPSPGLERRALREVAEIYLHHLREPRKAAPELARLAEAFPATPDGRWAREELGRVKEEMARQE